MHRREVGFDSEPTLTMNVLRHIGLFNIAAFDSGQSFVAEILDKEYSEIGGNGSHGSESRKVKQDLILIFRITLIIFFFFLGLIEIENRFF